MRLDKRLTNGLAWAGLALVIGVPSADLIANQFSSSAPLEVETASVAPLPTVLSANPIEPPAEDAASADSPAGTADAVDGFLASGRSMPAYISGSDNAAQPLPPTAGTPATETPNRVIPATGAPEAAPPATQPPPTDPVRTAATGPATTPVPSAAMPPASGTPAEASSSRLAPVPMPLSARPQAQAASPTYRVGDQRPASAIPAPTVAPTPAPVVVPPANVGSSAGASRPLFDEVTSDELAEWESGPLSDFLARRRAAQQAPRNGGGSVLIGPVNGGFVPFFLD